jgi:hypothetical protein
MAAPVYASALYLEEDADGDGDGMPDWWERLFFGDAGALPLDDPDWDGYLNLEEYEDRSDPLDDESVPAPPVIVYGDVPDPQVAPAPWTISAVITDNFEVASATLRWRRNTLTWRQAAMAPVDPPGHYVGVIPEPGILRDSFQYSIQAADPAGYLAQGETRSFSVAYPVAAVEPRRVDVLLRAGATTNVALTLGNTGNADLSWHAEVADAERGYDMESGTCGTCRRGGRCPGSTPGTAGMRARAFTRTAWTPGSPCPP